LKRAIKRGDVYWVNLDRPFGKRPAVIIQNDIGNKVAPSVIVVAITSVVIARSYPTDVLLPDGLLPKKNSRVLAANIYTIDKQQVEDYITTLSQDVMGQVDSALMASLDLEKYTRP